MNVLRIAISAELTRPITLPPFAASMVRGVLGNALRHKCCDCKPKAYGGHAPHCLYQLLFEGAPASTATLGCHLQTPPPPFTLKVFAHAPNLMRIEVCLFGIATQHVELWLDALMLGLSAGIGAQQVPVAIRKINFLELPIRTLPARLTLRLQSPMLIKHQSKPLQPVQLSGEILFTALARRMALMETLYQIGAPEVNFDRLKLAARSVGLQHNCQPINWARYSNRQQQKMPLSGMMGDITLTLPADLQDLLAPPLFWGQWLHVGGKAALGQGAYELITANTKRTAA
jgi:hypothetical protein